MTDIKTCITCKHCKIDIWPKFLAKSQHIKCNLEWEGKLTTNPVTGKETDKRELVRCHVRRTNGYWDLNNRCGPEGTQWESKSS